MGKKELRRREKSLALFFMLLLILINGCNTVKGAAEGAQKDWQSMREADQRLRDVLW